VLADREDLLPPHLRYESVAASKGEAEA